ncbi:MAG: hypothetical protein H0W05_07630 [Thermoleophilaceae bacterium]|nr:hypothetical protein [Thermoleophilaceae bacterium]
MERREQERDLTTGDIAGSTHPADETARPAGPQSPIDGSEGQPSTPDPEAETTSQPLLTTGDAEGFHRRWESIQIGFVDEPRRAVEDADKLVAEVIRRLAETFSEERSRLEDQWGRGEDVPTDDLRLTLQRYRSFFHRLLST